MKVQSPDDGKVLQFPIHGPGIRLVGATIEGSINLDDLCAADGAPLPPLVLERCLVPSPITLCRARLRYLSLNGSRVVHVRGKDAVISGPVDLCGLQSSQAPEHSTGEGKEGLCWVELQGASVGALLAGNARLVAPPKRSDFAPLSQEARYALDLTGAIVSGVPRLSPDFRALGGVSISRSELRNGFVADGAEMIAIERFVLDAGNAVIQGSALLRARDIKNDDSVPLKVVGDIRLRGATINGTLEMAGSRIEGSLFAQAADINGRVLLRAWPGKKSGKSETLRFIVTRNIDLYGTKITGGLDMAGAECRGDLNAEAIEIGGAATLRAKNGKSGGVDRILPFATTGRVLLNGAKVAGELSMAGASLSGALGLENSKIGSSLLLRAFHGKKSGKAETLPFISTRLVSLIGAEIAGNLDMQGARLEADINVQNAKIGGDVMMRVIDSKADGKAGVVNFTCGGRVMLLGTQINGSLDFGGAKAIGGINAHNIEVRGNALLRGSDSKGIDQTILFFAHKEVGLHGAKIKGNLEMDGANLVGGFNGHNIEVGGNVLMRAKEGKVSGKYDLFPFVASGRVGLHSAQVAGSIEMDGANFKADLNLQNAQVGASVLMRAKLGKIGGQNNLLGFISERKVSLLGAKIVGNLEMNGASFVGGFNATNIDVSGNVLMHAQINKLKGSEDGTLPFVANDNIYFDNARISQRLEISGAKFFHNANIQRPVIISLESARVGFLQDLGGSAWGGNLVLRMAAFQYGRLDRYVDNFDAKSSPNVNAASPLVRPHLWRLIGRYPRKVVGWIAASPRHLSNILHSEPLKVPAWTLLLILAGEGFAIASTLFGWIPWKLSALGLAVIGLMFWILSEADFRTPAWRSRMQWLNLQYKTRRPTRDEYLPEPYESLAKAFRLEGEYDEARRITSARLTIERKLNVHVMFRWLVWLYALCFDYGLSPLRAVVTFISCIAVGWAAVTVADAGFDQSRFDKSLPGQMLGSLNIKIPPIRPVLVVDANAVTSIASLDLQTGRQTPKLLGPDIKGTSPEELSCGELIEPLLFALDVFVPALELHQESKCSLSTDTKAFWWRIAAAAYSILGWIITSLTVLTVSGVLRRHVEG